MEGGLSRIDVPDASAVSFNSGNPSDPKTWKGPWRSVTNPHEIAKVVCSINATQYHQAHATPFGSGPLAELIGCKEDTVTSADLLRGQLPNPFPPDILPETIRVLQSLASPTPTTEISPAITEEELHMKTHPYPPQVDISVIIKQPVETPTLFPFILR